MENRDNHNTKDDNDTKNFTAQAKGSKARADNQHDRNKGQEGKGGRPHDRSKGRQSKSGGEQ